MLTALFIRSEHLPYGYLCFVFCFVAVVVEGGIKFEDVGSGVLKVFLEFLNIKVHSKAVQQVLCSDPLSYGSLWLLVAYGYMLWYFQTTLNQIGDNK